ncbi:MULTISPECIES: DUF1344 domain-containing protein [Hyphomicrobiales]|jgi:opacity protein-like surface antigen|uniref:DUF1344 domain-containing protein n=1 Tax=Hyphomicrobiales TaxID=356 RepID=UPI000399D488|nr:MULTISPECIES: DUF1344 domain-containing protein [Phyllobacteriaceae]MCX8567920.1 DUF1344 domain-containing protein [Aminobacter sp. MET-1]
MRKFVLAAAALALMSGAAMASEVDGVVAKFNPHTRVITLKDGESYTIPMDVAIPTNIAAGKKVAISEHDNGAKIDYVLVGHAM